ncbi:MAG: cyclic nucleotide-binding domain-containing protein [Hydrogenophaga sp.]|jgi:CRP-like cAMP-binding protein|nr:cyclic nucleotide-binding domain-containing protein [Comamonadaceae bacterium]MBS4036589.1 cyclic nucleotide-binding domain-containing protein [Hydrogenophaga sp.]
MLLLDRLLRQRETRRRRLRVRASEHGMLAAGLLRSPSALAQLSEDDAVTVLAYMQLRRFGRGESIVREGDDASGQNGFMALVVEGEVTVESQLMHRAQPLTVNVLGPGEVLGEMALLDGDARSASCNASTDGVLAVLRRESLQSLMEEEPVTAARLLAAVGYRLSLRLRDLEAKYKVYDSLVASLQAEVGRPGRR